MQEEIKRLQNENIHLKYNLDEASNQNIPAQENEALHQRLAQKDIEIEKLRAELKKANESSHHIRDHSNRILSENAKFKEETDTIVISTKK